MMTQLPRDILNTVRDNSDMQRYLESLLRHVPFTPRSWLYDGEGGNPYMQPDAIRDKWLTSLSVLQKRGDHYAQEVYSFDAAQLEKWGPQGGHAPIASLMSDIVMPSFEMGAARGYPRAYDSGFWEMAKLNTVKLLKQHGVHSLRPASFEKVVDNMRSRDTLESNSGFPSFARRNKPEVKERAISDARSGAWKTYPAIALFRTYNGKTRLVWIFPMSTNLVEGSYFQPLQNAIMHSELSETFFSPWKGFEQVRLSITNSYSAGNEIGASDFTSTDAHFQLVSSLEVLDVISECFQYQYRAGLKESIVHMHNIPLLVGPRRMLVGQHGVASGSNWTNFVETVFDIILGEYVRIYTQGTVKLLYAIGDDMAWEASRFPDGFREELETIGNSVGQVIKAEKTMMNPSHVKTLQRLFQKGYFQEDSSQLRGVYSTIRALKSSVYPERTHKKNQWNADMFCARQFMILENCVDHPLFKDFVRFVCKGNRHLIPFAKQSSQQLDAIYREAKLIPGLTPSYNQEKKEQSLAAFKSIGIAREL